MWIDSWVAPNAWRIAPGNAYCKWCKWLGLPRKKTTYKTSVEDASQISKLQTLQDQPPRFTKIIQDRSSSAKCPGCHIRPSGARNAGHHPQTSKRPARLHRQSEHGLTSRRTVHRYNLGNWHFGPLWAKVRASWSLVRMLLQKRIKTWDNDTNYVQLPPIYGSCHIFVVKKMRIYIR
jgi:hypothetical protein